VASTLAICLIRQSQKRSPACAKFNLKALQDKTISQQFKVELRNRFSVLEEDDLDNCDSVQEVAKDVLALKTNSKQDWISDSTRDLIDKKREFRLKRDKPLHKKLIKECRAQVRHDRQRGSDTLALEGESMLQSSQLQGGFTNLRKLRQQTSIFPAL